MRIIRVNGDLARGRSSGQDGRLLAPQVATMGHETVAPGGSTRLGHSLVLFSPIPLSTTFVLSVEPPLSSVVNRFSLRRRLLFNIQ